MARPEKIRMGDLLAREKHITNNMEQTTVFLRSRSVPCATRRIKRLQSLVEGLER